MEAEWENAPMCLRLLELCAGEGHSWSQAGRALGFECVTLDWAEHCKADLHMDVRCFRPEEHGKFQIVCASPDCKELSQARSHAPGSKRGDEAFADSVGKACVSIIEYYVPRGAEGFLENPVRALPRRPWMRQYDHLATTIDYCMFSGPRPADFDGSRPCRQKLGDWHPARKPTAIYVFGGQ